MHVSCNSGPNEHSHPAGTGIDSGQREYWPSSFVKTRNRPAVLSNGFVMHRFPLMFGSLNSNSRLHNQFSPTQQNPDSDAEPDLLSTVIRFGPVGGQYTAKRYPDYPNMQFTCCKITRLCVVLLVVVPRILGNTLLSKMARHWQEISRFCDDLTR
jgi:hypothetical protein